MKRIDFNLDIDFDSKEELQCFLNDEELIFIDYGKYDGPITMQLLPNGGIICLFNDVLVIQCKNGFLGVNELKYQNKTYKTSEFLKEFKDLELINQVLR